MVQYYDYIWGYKLTNIPLQKMSQDNKQVGQVKTTEFCSTPTPSWVLTARPRPRLGAPAAPLHDIKIQEINFIALWLYIYDSYAALMP